MKNLTFFALLCWGFICHASPTPKDTIYTSMETLMREVKNTKKKTATYYLHLATSDDKEVKVRIDLKQIDAEIPIYKSNELDIKKLLALKEESLEAPMKKFEEFKIKLATWKAKNKEVEDLKEQIKTLKSGDSLAWDTQSIDSVQEIVDQKSVELANNDKAYNEAFNEYEKMIGDVLGNLKNQYTERLSSAIEEAYNKLGNIETVFLSAQDSPTWHDIRINLIKLDARRQMKVSYTARSAKKVTENITAGKFYYILHFAEFGLFFPAKVQDVIDAIKQKEIKLNPFLTGERFALVCDDQDRTQHHINNVMDPWGYDVEKEIRPKPGDPLVEMEIASPGASGKKGGTFGCTRNGEHRKCEKGLKYHGGMDIYAEQDTKLYSMYAGTVISLFDKIGRDVYHSSAKEEYRYSESYVGSLGNDIQIRSEINGKIVVIRYCHLNAINVKVGDSVKQGDIIGITGRNGNAGKKGGMYASNEPHLHLQIRVNNKTENPNDYLGTKFDTNGLPIN
ncbi:M23 family metallopeptidase [Flagellimonas marinaquae]|uniref:M23 family metallopeptidase n=1 Tax=Flagellimonas marinaquae TaxID=254955 RepID=UPI000F8F391F|nr:M23 family metallopeptidase [Allomuricauda aquimarina]